LLRTSNLQPAVKIRKHSGCQLAGVFIIAAHVESNLQPAVKIRKYSGFQLAGACISHACNRGSVKPGLSDGADDWGQRAHVLRGIACVGVLDALRCWCWSQGSAGDVRCGGAGWCLSRAGHWEGGESSALQSPSPRFWCQATLVHGQRPRARLRPGRPGPRTCVPRAGSAGRLGSPPRPGALEGRLPPSQPAPSPAVVREWSDPAAGPVQAGRLSGPGPFHATAGGQPPRRARRARPHY
jgi:hypothetical protein